MALFWFLAGVLSTLAVLLLLLPWLRSASALRSLRWQATGAAVLVLAAALGLYRWLGRPELVPAPAPAAAAGAATDRDAQAASTARAGSMSSAIAQLQARLAKGNGSDGDWELLAKSYEFLGLPHEAGEARAHRLPPPEAGAAPSPAADTQSAAGGEGTVVRGEVTLAAALRAKASPGATLFIVAKAPALPGPPVAVIRRSVSTWPVEFTLDDSQSMMPGRTLSSAGKVTVEARISQSGQAMPAPGDLVGTSGEIDPAANRALTITIDHVVQ